MYLSGTNNPELPGAQTADTADEQPRYGFDICRLIDIVAAAGALLFFAPMMMAVALAIKIQDGGPIFFGHTRIGFEGRTFRCWKFRTMVVDAEEQLKQLLANDLEAQAQWRADHKLKRDPRVTWLGRFLRTSSIDELPQLFNVVNGEMSLVGPRPIVAGEIRRYGRWFAHYCGVRPGITGMWQVSGRNDVPYRRRVAMDILYARERSLLLNLRLMVATIPAVLLRRGSY